MAARMTNLRARKIVADWLKANGKQVPWEGHDYATFVTVVRKTSGVARPADPSDLWSRPQACAWLRQFARAIEAAAL